MVPETVHANQSRISDKYDTMMKQPASGFKQALYSLALTD